MERDQISPTLKKQSVRVTQKIYIKILENRNTAHFCNNQQTKKILNRSCLQFYIFWKFTMLTINNQNIIKLDVQLFLISCLLMYCLKDRH